MTFYFGRRDTKSQLYILYKAKSSSCLVYCPSGSIITFFNKKILKKLEWWLRRKKNKKNKQNLVIELTYKHMEDHKEAEDQLSHEVFGS